MAVSDSIAVIVRFFKGESAASFWTPNDERIRGYKAFQQLFEGKHATALSDFYKLDSTQIHIIVNLPRVICSVPADLMLGEPFTVDYPDDVAPSDDAQKAITEILKRSTLQTTAYEVAVDGAHQGDMLYVAERGEDGLARIRSIAPSIWFPEYDPDNTRDVRVHRLAWERMLMDRVQKKYLRVLEHHKGFIVNRLFALKEGKVDEELPQSNEVWSKLYPGGLPEEEQETGIDDFLLVHVPNARSSNDYFGYSDLRDLKSIVAGINQRTAQNNKVLRDHAEPSIAVSESMWSWLRGPDAQSEMGGSIGDRLLVDPRILKVQRKGPNGETSEYITWDGKVADSEAFVKRLKTDAYELAEIDSSLWSSDGVGQIASGRALRLRLVRTLAKVNRKWKYQSDGLEKIIKLAAELEGITVEDMVLEKSDGLPADTLEDIQASAQRISAGLSSKLREIMRLEDLDEIEAKALLDEIEEEDARATEQLVQATRAANPHSAGRSPINVVMGAE